MVSSASTVSPCQFVLSFSEAQSARVNTHKKKHKNKMILPEQMDLQSGMYSRHIRTLDTRHSQHNSTTATYINLQRSLLFEKETNKKSKHNACKHSIVPLERAMAKLVHARDSNEQTHAQFTIDQYFSSGYQLAQAAPVTKKMKNKQTHHHGGTRAGQYLPLPEGPTRRKISCSATTIANDAQFIYHFCSRDQLAEARNAITCDIYRYDKN
jgi:hypothetical protein